MIEQTCIDLTHPVHNAMPVFPGDGPALLEQVRHIDRDGFNDFRIQSGMHVGTHMDTPLHMLEGQADISQIPVNRFFGRGHIIDCGNTPRIDTGQLTDHAIGQGDIVLFHTGHDACFGQDSYFLDYPVITEECADALADLKVNMVGIDTPSPDLAPFPVHKKLFRANILILENLTNLSLLQGADRIDIFAFPLKIQADGAPVRVIATIS